MKYLLTILMVYISTITQAQLIGSSRGEDRGTYVYIKYTPAEKAKVERQKKIDKLNEIKYIKAEKAKRRLDSLNYINNTPFRKIDSLIYISEYWRRIASNEHEQLEILKMKQKEMEKNYLKALYSRDSLQNNTKLILTNPQYYRNLTTNW